MLLTLALVHKGRDVFRDSFLRSSLFEGHTKSLYLWSKVSAVLKSRINTAPNSRQLLFSWTSALSGFFLSYFLFSRHNRLLVFDDFSVNFYRICTS